MKKTSSPLRRSPPSTTSCLRPSRVASPRTAVWLLFKNDPPCSVISPPEKKSRSVQHRPPARAGFASYTVDATGLPGP